MKTIYLITLLILIFSEKLHAENWVDIVNNDKVTISIEENLFEKSGSDNFFIHFKIANKSNKIIGFDLDKNAYLFYPNQWGESDKDHREDIDEMTMLPKEIDGEMNENLMSKYNAHKLNEIAIGGEVEYYINFNNRGRKEVDAGVKNFILLSIKGQIIFSNGLNVWDEKADIDISIKRPIKWQSMDKNILIIEK